VFTNNRYPSEEGVILMEGREGEGSEENGVADLEARSSGRGKNASALIFFDVMNFDHPVAGWNP
jgi:hypothetical protein